MVYISFVLFLYQENVRFQISHVTSTVTAGKEVSFKVDGQVYIETKFRIPDLCFDEFSYHIMQAN